VPAIAPPETETAFSAAWEAFFRAARRARSRARAGNPDDLTVPQYHVLEPLDAGPRTVGALASTAGVSAPTATRMLDTLCRQGVVERHPSEQDRRFVLIALTGEGRRRLEAKRQEVRAMQQRVALLLDDDERAEATRLLQRLTDAMENL
jgi:DNA-binding MarR family transcriptional regulator